MYRSSRALGRVFAGALFTLALVRPAHAATDEADTVSMKHDPGRYGIVVTATKTKRDPVDIPNGTTVVKFFLHLSREEQRKSYIARIDEPDKNWKFQSSDVGERQFWKDYMHAYQDALGATSTRHAPWYIVPADDKQNARLIVSQVILDTLEGLKMRYPATSAERRRELQAMRRRLAAKAG